MTFSTNGPLLLAGAGKMGGAILKGLLAQGLDARSVIAQDPSPPPDVAALLADNAIDVVPAIDELTEPPGVVLVAVKPQIMQGVLPGLAKLAGPDTLFLSIAAGQRLQTFEKFLPDAAVVRAMPNTPAAILKGMSVAVANAQVTPAQRALANAILSAVGEVEWVDDEALLDPVTAVSGSGPAYVFLLAEAMEDAARRQGLPDDTARTLVLQTVLGAARMLTESDEPPAELRRRVTSPGGTTQAAIETFERGGLRALVGEAIGNAAERGRQLSAAND